jgi:ubiquinone/menaquinone biosynthesis C-methylase UbiE
MGAMAARQQADAAHWDQAYRQGESTRSWHQNQPTMSLHMLHRAGAVPSERLIDIGGGSAPLVDVLLEQGFTDLTVLDISQTGLHYAQQRLGPAAAGVTWLLTDVLTWQPERTYQLWHDRAVFHFLTNLADQRRYVDLLTTAVEPGGRVVIGAFAADGPQQCSGLPVARYSADSLTERLGPTFTVLVTEREEHHTPSGAVQPFTWLLAQHASNPGTPG